MRQLRARLKKGELTTEQYEAAIEKATIEVIRWQEEIGLDVLVYRKAHERNAHRSRYYFTMVVCAR
ncbi:hypothetical protein [Chitinophaga polysaccharea]|uniref:hypothetical protein n=1 Tax=Chitinophaga polysaccharea TaxID=1293035 RepID=UPI0028A6B1F2|nr:hypothetical protein [Chitinophaga polysaccharea]